MAKQFLQTQDIINKVFDSDNNVLRVAMNGASSGASLSPEQSSSLLWLTENMGTIQSLLNSPGAPVQNSVLSKDITLNSGFAPGTIGIDGIYSAGSTDNKYHIDISGYVLDVEIYPDSNSNITERYYTKITYDPSSSITHIILDVEEYTTISSLQDGKNILRIFYLGTSLN